MGRPGKWILGLLGTTVLGMLLAVLLGALGGWVVGLVAEAHHAGPAWVAVPSVAAGVFVFVVLMLVYSIKVGPWLAKFRPVPPSLRSLADLADSYAGVILRFEGRNPTGAPIQQRPLADVLDELSDPTRISDSWTRFEAEYGLNLRNLFHDLKDAELVEEGEMPLFYYPRTTDDRVALASRLRWVAFEARKQG